MDYYYIIVSAVATIILVLVLTYVGILMTSTQKKASYPPSYNLCPDYWESQENGKCKIPDANSINTKAAGKSWEASSTPGLDTASSPTFINFSDPGWSAGGTGDQRCGWKKWASYYGIQWDGVTNYTEC